MAFASQTFILVLLSLLASVFPNQVGFRIPLIYRNNPNFSIAERVRLDEARLEAVSYPPSLSYHGKNFRGRMTRFYSDFLVEIYIGYPPQRRYLDFDTGSDITWIQCHPCRNCSEKSVPPFNATDSDTYKTIECDDLTCPKVDKRFGCIPNNMCFFSINYYDGTRVNGLLGIESFHFSTINVGVFHRISPLIFGCAYYDNSNPRIHEADGKFGLSLGTMSFIHQLGVDKFSYCIPSELPSEETVSHSQIRFGSMAITIGNRTPFVRGPWPLYVIKLVGVSFGRTKLDLQLPEQGHFDIAVDSGATGTWLHPKAFRPLIEALDDEIDLEKRPFPGQDCYEGTMDGVEHITVTLHFEGGIDIEMSKSMLVLEEKASICFLVLRAKEMAGGLSLFGIRGQMNHNVGYDLRSGEMSFYPINCENI